MRVEIAALPWRARRPEMHPRAWLDRFAPTRRSLAIGFGLLAFALGGYMLARETSMFAIRGIEVQGGSPRVAAQVRQALASFVGKPLVGLDGSAVQRTIDALPTVVRSSYDRAFPHTLRVTIVPERPAAVLRRGAETWLVSIRGRVMERLPALGDRKLPRIWVSGRTPVTIGAELRTADTAVAARAVGLAGSFAHGVATASYSAGTLVFHLRSGLQLLLGDGSRVRLKVAVAERTLPAVPAGSTFLDVSVPGRPVSGTGQPVAEELQGSSRG
jgi:cell division protein FtsQ